MLSDQKLTTRKKEAYIVIMRSRRNHLNQMYTRNLSERHAAGKEGYSGCNPQKAAAGYQVKSGVMRQGMK